MRIHSMVDCITNSSSTAFMFPLPEKEIENKIKKLFIFISKITKDKNISDVDLSKELEITITPREDWISDQKDRRTNKIMKYNENREKCSNLTDAEFEHFYGKIELDEDFENYINNPDNSWINGEDGLVPYTQLSVKLSGEDITEYFNIYDAKIIP